VPLYSPAIISPVRDNTKPVGSPVGLVVKKRWKIFSGISRGIMMLFSRAI